MAEGRGARAGARAGGFRGGLPALLEQAVAKAVGGLLGAPAPTTPTKGWACKCKDCPAATKGRLNFPDRSTCHGCGRPKAKACNPPADTRLSPPGGGSASGGKSAGVVPGDSDTG